MQWHAPRANLKFVRDQEGIVGRAGMDLQLAGEVADSDAGGRYGIEQGSAIVTIRLAASAHPCVLTLAPQLQPLAALHLPTGGTLRVRYALDGGLTDVRFDLAGGAGVIDARPSHWRCLAGAVGRHPRSIDQRVEGSRRGRIPRRSGRPLVTLKGRAEGLGGATSLQATAKIEELPVDDLGALWPPDLAPNPRAWILANLSHGRIGLATARLAAHVTPGQSLADALIDDIGGTVIADGVTVQYLRPMQPVQNVSCTAVFDANAFTIDVKSGEVIGLTVQEGKVVLGGLSRSDQYADINVLVDGPVADALRLIDSKPLGWAQALGLQPGKVEGDAVINLALQFPLLRKLSLSRLKVHAKAQTTHLAMPGAALGLDLSEGNLTLDVDPQGMDVAGKALLGGLPADIRWRENFTRGMPFRSRYQVAASLDDAGRKTIGLDGAPFQPPFLSGSVPVDVTATLTESGKGEIDIKASLIASAMQLPDLNWEKRPGIMAQASATLRLVDGKLGEVPSFGVSAANGLDVRGRIGFDNGRPRYVSFHKASWGRTDVKGTLTIKPGDDGLDLDLSGASLDAREMIAGAPSDHQTDKAPAERRRKVEREENKDVVPLNLRAKIGQIWVSDRDAVHAVTAVMSRNHRDWRHVVIDGTVGAGGPLHIELQPLGGNHRKLSITSGDAGAVFRSLNIFENVVGGKLAVDASYDDADPRQPLTGLATVADYQVVKAPALARLLTVAALTGIVDLLQGQGIPFSTMDVPFTLTDGVLELKDARAFGTALGITAKGRVDLDNDVLALEGTVVPIYALNSVLGNIPLVGGLFSAEKGAASSP